MHRLVFQTCFKVFLLFSKSCGNSGARIIHMAAGMHLGVTPQAVYNSLFCHCVQKIFLSFQIENEKASNSLPNVLFLCFPFGLSSSWSHHLVTHPLPQKALHLLLKSWETSSSSLSWKVQISPGSITSFKLASLWLPQDTMAVCSYLIWLSVL